MNDKTGNYITTNESATLMSSEINAASIFNSSLDSSIYRMKASYSYGPNIDNYDYHKHAVFDIFVQLEKSVTYYIEDTQYKLTKGDVLLINSHELHKMPNKGDMNFRRLTIFFDPKNIRTLSSKYTNLLLPFEHNLGENNIIHLTSAELNELCAFAEELVAFEESTDFGTDIMALSTMLRILIMLNKIYRKQYSSHLQILSDRIHLICKYIDNETPKIKSVQEVSEHFAMSRSHISKIFKEETGITIGDYITKQKLEFAISLLKLGFNASDVSYVSGFCDYASFYRTLKRKTGKSPRDFKTPIDVAPDHRLDLTYYL